MVANVEGSWHCELSILDKAAIVKQERYAQVPAPYTEAQMLARYHEDWHARDSPENWFSVRTQVMSLGDENGINLDSDAVIKLSKMLEENRVDGELWFKRKIDMRPARESLNWAKMTLPDDDPLEATCQVLQLAWTVWGSGGNWSAAIAGMPPARDLHPAVKEYFDHAWAIVQSYDRDLAQSVIEACVAMYIDPDHDTRNEVAFELAQYFLKEEEYQQPEPTPEELAAQEEAEKEEEEELEQEVEAATGGDNNPIENRGHWEYHDHTKGQRRPRIKIRKKSAPMEEGVVFRYPHRWMLDKRVFGRRHRKSGSILVDMSGSMQWTNDDMIFLLERMPEIWIGGYAGHTIPSNPNIKGRLCIHAREGRFNEFTGMEPTYNKENAIDLEALRELAKQPEPRLWLSDGGVVGGILMGQCHPEYTSANPYWQSIGRLVYEVDKLMKQARIIRIDTKDDMVKLFKKQRIKAYRNTRMLPGGWCDSHYPPELVPEPISYSL